MRFRDHDAPPLQRHTEHDPGDEDDAVDFDAWFADWQTSNARCVAALRATLDWAAKRDRAVTR